MDVELSAMAIRLDEILDDARRSLDSAPDGSLRVARSHGFNQFRVRESSGRDRYLSKADADLVRRLAQKRYDKEVVRVAWACRGRVEGLLRQLDESGLPRTAVPRLSADQSDARDRGLVLSTVDGCRELRGASVRVREVEDVYAQLPEEIREFVDPYEVDDELFLAQWLGETRRGTSFLADECRFRTEQGERVRSKSEVIIADKLHRAGIPYAYEPSVTFRDGEVMRPDFLVLNTRTRQELLWEHFGLMDDEQYRKRAWSKLAHYTASGLVPGDGLIVTFESKAVPLITEMVDDVVDSFLR